MGKADKQDRLFNLHQNLVHSLAWRIHRRSFQKVAIEDLIAYGQLGLIQAIRSFDASYGTKFTTYAWYRVRGAIFDGLATMAWFDRGSFERGEYEQPDDTDLTVGSSKICRATYYGYAFAGLNTASGEVFDPEKFTAAHKELPFNTIVRVTNLANDKFVVVRINDRGPFTEGLEIDLSQAAFAEIANISTGVIDVLMEVLE